MYKSEAHEPHINLSAPVSCSTKTARCGEEAVCPSTLLHITDRLPRKSPWYVLNLHNSRFRTVIRQVRAEFGRRNVFAPRCSDIVSDGGRIRKTHRAYVLPDLLFVHARHPEIESFRRTAAATCGISPFAFYRDRCGGQGTPMTVEWDEMQRFMRSYTAKDRCPTVHSVAEIGAPGGFEIERRQRVRILNGSLCGVEGHFLTSDAKGGSTPGKQLAIILANAIVLRITLDNSDVVEVV